jgi:hypothetical protein
MNAYVSLRLQWADSGPSMIARGADLRKRKKCADDRRRQQADALPKFCDDLIRRLV